MKRFEFYLGIIFILCALSVHFDILQAQIENSTQQTTINCIDSLYHVDGVRFAIVRRDRDMPAACLWTDQTQDGKGYEIIKSSKKGFIIDLRD